LLYVESASKFSFEADSALPQNTPDSITCWLGKQPSEYLWKL
jgi:hypothetical protein